MAVVLSQTGKGKKLVLKMSLAGSNFPPECSNVIGLWRMDTQDVVGHTNVVEGTEPEFTTEFLLDHYLSSNLKVKFCAYNVKDGNVDVDGFVGCHETDLGTLFKGKQSEGMLGDSGIVLKFNVSVQADPKDEKKKKEEEKSDTPKLTKEQLKEIAAAEKEGGKKGQDISGMSAFGVHFFCVSVESAPDNWPLMESIMTGMNKEVDPEAEDRKGGASDLGKILFCATEKSTKLLMYAHVPAEQSDKATVKEFLEAVCAPCEATIIEAGDNFAKAEVAHDPDNNKYVLKMKDAAIAAGFEFLRKKGLVMDDDDGDEINFADECGIVLNAGGASTAADADY